MQQLKQMIVERCASFNWSEINKGTNIEIANLRDRIVDFATGVAVGLKIGVNKKSVNVIHDTVNQIFNKNSKVNF